LDILFISGILPNCGYWHALGTFKVAIFNYKVFTPPFYYVMIFENERSRKFVNPEQNPHRNIPKGPTIPVGEICPVLKDLRTVPIEELGGWELFNPLTT
jgi:hypothetical protein